MLKVNTEKVPPLIWNCDNRSGIIATENTEGTEKIKSKLCVLCGKF